MLHLDGHELATLLATYGYWSVLVLVTVESLGLLAYGYGASVAHVGGPLGIVSAGVATALVGGLLVTLHRQQRRLQRQADSMVAGGEALAA